MIYARTPDDLHYMTSVTLALNPLLSDRRARLDMGASLRGAFHFGPLFSVRPPLHNAGHLPYGEGKDHLNAIIALRSAEALL